MPEIFDSRKATPEELNASAKWLSEKLEQELAKHPAEGDAPIEEMDSKDRIVVRRHAGGKVQKYLYQRSDRARQARRVREDVLVENSECWCVQRTSSSMASMAGS